LTVEGRIKTGKARPPASQAPALQFTRLDARPHRSEQYEDQRPQGFIFL